MPCPYGGRRILSARESSVWAGGFDDQQSPCPDRLDADGRYLGDGITRAEVMEYLGQTYGPVFAADLASRLS